MPAKTHSRYPSKGSGLKPHVTLREAIEDVHSRDDRQPKGLGYMPTDSDRPVQNVMENSPIRHPNGTENLGNAHWARLQGFTNEHKFSAPGVRKQICNAYPPSYAKLVFACIRQHLQEQDNNLIFAVSKPAMIPDLDISEVTAHSMQKSVQVKRNL